MKKILHVNYGTDDKALRRSYDLMYSVLVSLMETKEFDLAGWTSGIEKDTGDILFFFRYNQMYGMVEKFLNTLKEKWNTENFEILEDTILPNDEYFYEGKKCHFFRLKSLI